MNSILIMCSFCKQFPDASSQKTMADDRKDGHLTERWVDAYQNQMFLFYDLTLRKRVGFCTMCKWLYQSWNTAINWGIKLQLHWIKQAGSSGQIKK